MPGEALRSGAPGPTESAQHSPVHGSCARRARRVAPGAVGCVSRVRSRVRDPAARAGAHAINPSLSNRTVSSFFVRGLDRNPRRYARVRHRAAPTRNPEKCKTPRNRAAAAIPVYRPGPGRGDRPGYAHYRPPARRTRDPVQLYPHTATTHGHGSRMIAYIEPRGTPRHRWPLIVTRHATRSDEYHASATSRIAISSCTWRLEHVVTLTGTH